MASLVHPVIKSLRPGSGCVCVKRVGVGSVFHTLPQGGSIVQCIVHVMCR